MQGLALSSPCVHLDLARQSCSFVSPGTGLLHRRPFFVPAPPPEGSADRLSKAVQAAGTKTSRGGTQKRERRSGKGDILEKKSMITGMTIRTIRTIRSPLAMRD